jgi:bacterioferritin
MGSKGREIVGPHVKPVLERLNKAFADEWLAYYQYWLGAKLAAGPMKEAVTAELIQHSLDELRHADLLAARIIQLGGTPALSPHDWYVLSGCGYDPPADPSVVKLLAQNIKGEQCAIALYSELARFVMDKDPVTYNLATQLLSDEVEHEEDLQALQADIRVMMKPGRPAPAGNAPARKKAKRRRA